MLIPLLEPDYQVIGWGRRDSVPGCDWDLVICCLGSVAPVGLWHDLDETQFLLNLESNLITPIRLLQRIWKNRRLGATVCMLAGSNPQMIMDGYAAYNIGKMALLKAVEQLDQESPDAKFFALGPGTVLTKIHQPTLDVKWDNPKLDKAMSMPKFGLPQQVYQCLMWAIDQPKEVIGGRNICASDQFGPGLAQQLKDDPWMFKLRRIE
jgi:NAD(P)-dependent dehydrogenase (short-subunit alcohol dehydrogenase family)